jgi:hypothetical protein
MVEHGRQLGGGKGLNPVGGGHVRMKEEGASYIVAVMSSCC